MTISKRSLVIGASLGVLCHGVCYGQHIAYDAHTQALVASASYWQTIAGNCLPSRTVNGMICGCPFSGSEFDGWAIAGQIGLPNSILWTFVGGERQVDAMQLLNVYFNTATNGPHRLNGFDLFYTTDASPSLASPFLPLPLTACTAPTAIVVGNRVTITCPTPVDYRVSWSSVACTAIRLTNLAQPMCSNNGNFVLTEVSFRTTTPGVRFFGASTPGCLGQLAIGVNRPPTVGALDFSVIVAGVETGAVGLLALGALQTSPFQLLGLEVWLNPLVAVFPALQSGAMIESLATPVPIPNDPGLAGFSFGAQFAWTSACQPQGFASSRALRLTIQ